MMVALALELHNDADAPDAEAVRRFASAELTGLGEHGGLVSSVELHTCRSGAGAAITAPGHEFRRE